MYNKKEVLQKVDMLYNMWKEGSLGGEVGRKLSLFYITYGTELSKKLI